MRGRRQKKKPGTEKVLVGTRLMYLCRYGKDVHGTERAPQSPDLAGR